MNLASAFKLFLGLVFLINLSLLLLDQRVGKDLQKQSEILYEDELVRNPSLKSNINITPHKFIQIYPGAFLYFRSLHLDPTEAADPTLKGLLLWLEEDGNTVYYRANYATIANGLLSIERGTKYTLSNGEASLPPIQREYVVDVDLHINLLNNEIKKYPTVTTGALTMRETYNLMGFSQMLRDAFPIWWYLVLPIIVFVLFPLVSYCFASQILSQLKG